MKHDYTCEVCKKNTAFRIGLCGGCGKRTHLCRGCFSSFVACDEKCRAKWREEAAQGLPKEKIAPNVKARRRKPKGYEVFQKELGQN